MAKTFSCNECRSIFSWKPEQSLSPVCPNCGNTKFSIGFGSQDKIDQQNKDKNDNVKDKVKEAVGLLSSIS